MKIYVAGPITYNPAKAAKEFDEAQATLERMGHYVINPIDMDRKLDGFDPAKDKPKPHIYYMKRDLPILMQCQAVAVLPGWERSQGAMLEVHTAIVCGIPVYEYVAGAGLTRSIFFGRPEVVDPTRPRSIWMGGICAYIN